MNNRADKPAVKDWLILGGIVSGIAIVAFDIIAVRGRNKTLRIELEKTAVSAQVQVKQAEEKATEEISRIEQKIKSFEKKAIEAKKKMAEVEAEFREKIDSLRIVNQNKLKDQKDDYEQRIAKMQEDFNDRMNKLRESMRKSTVRTNMPDTGSNSHVRCGKCYGSGKIKVKERCATCNGRGKVEKQSVGHRTGGYRANTSVSTYMADCPDCLPGPMKGSGSKGYTIELKSCSKCGGVGSVPRK